MPAPRHTVVDISSTPYYHCISRCVRRAFLCGKDPYNGRDYEHRRDWVAGRLKFLAGVFAIDVCAFAVMSNHLHVVIRVAPERAQGWPDEEVVERYGRLFRTAKERYSLLPAARQVTVAKMWRSRLYDLSWMMRALNEWIARRANSEDDCRGHFWESRFKSQAILDEQGLLTCMAYVDLNPVRAGRANDLDDSDFTSIQARLRTAARRRDSFAPSYLVPFMYQTNVAKTAPTREPLGVALPDYVEVLQWTVRALRSPSAHRELPPRMLTQHRIDADCWVATLKNQRLQHASVVGGFEAVCRAAKRRGLAWHRGKRLARQLSRAA